MIPAERVADSIHELRLLTVCRCADDYTRRNRHEPNTACYHAEDVELVAAKIAELKANKGRFHGLYTATADELERYTALLVEPDQSTAVMNLIALRNQTNGEGQ